MDHWPTTIFACPNAGPEGSLRVQPEAGWFCDDSGLAYPLLGGCPILVPEPARWIAEHRDALLATLSEHGLADSAAVATVATLAEPWLNDAHEPFQDDWTVAERKGIAEPQAPLAGPAAAAVSTLLRVTAEGGAIRCIVDEVNARNPEITVEVGPGAGLLSVVLARCSRRLALVDRSLRAVLMARGRAREVEQAEVFGLVADADALCLRPGSVDAVVAANLLDLLEDPEQFLESAAEGLRSGGALVTCTPRPCLRHDDPDDALVTAVESTGLSVEICEDGLPWIRCHSAREYQVFLCQVLVATKR